MLQLNIPTSIKIIINENWIKIEGPLGVIIKKKSPSLTIFFDANTRLLFLKHKNTILNGFYLKIINQLIWGVWKGYCKKLKIIGVGYKISLMEDCLEFKVGFSHIISYKIPKNIKIKILNKKLLIFLIFGIDFQKVTQTAAEIIALKPVDAYKGKGIKYFDQVTILKEGKKTNV